MIGYSFSKINPLQQICLEKIAKEYERTGKRPKVLDAGAGHGLMTWKMIGAGGHVTAIEKYRPAAEEMQKTIVNAKPCLAENEKWKDIFSPVHADLVSYDHKDRKYYLSWSGNLLHFFTPSQIEAYMPNLFKITESGGFAFATVQAVSMNPSIVSLYKKRLEAGEKYPGYLATNRVVYRGVNEQTKQQANVGLEIIDAAEIKGNDDILPGEERYGFYGSNQKEPEWSSYKKENGYQIYSRKTHNFVHVFAPAQLQKIFETVGFRVEDMFYISGSGKKSLNEVSEDDLSNNPYLLGVIARKP